MSLHVIAGAGPVGSTTAKLLAERGHQVRIVSRRGAGPEAPGIERVKADASDATRLTELADGATAIYNCVNPAYHRWLEDWPPLEHAFLTAAESSGAVLAIAGTLYGYGPVDSVITPQTPLAATHPKLRIRADMWRRALALHNAGKIRVTEVRGSDYIEGEYSIFKTAIGTALRAGRRAFAPAALDAPHTWTSTTDMARTLITVADDERGWGKAWLTPSHAPLTVRELANRFVEANNLPQAKLTRLPYAALWAAGLTSPMAREFRTTYYQWSRPFTMDSTETEKTFNLTPIDLDDALRAVPQ